MTNQESLVKPLLFLNGPTPASFSFIFGLIKQILQFLQQIYVKKPPSSIWCWDSNPRPLECESLPITTRPEISPNLFFFFVFSIQLIINVQYKFFTMTGFKLRSSGIRSNRSTNWATTTAQPFFFTRKPSC